MNKRNIIVIGTSAGGFTALKTLVSELPADLNASIFIVWHMAPEMRGILPEVLNRYGNMYAANAVDGMSIKSGCIYVAPPDHHLMLDDGVMRVTRGPKENRFRPAIDPLFRSAAYSYTNRVIGVVLSGALDDGASGLWTIKHSGGLAIVQDPLDAEVASMPEHALAAVAVDFCVPVQEIAGLLIKLSNETVATMTDDVKQKDQIKAEVESAANISGAALSLFKSGSLTPYTCPECGGVLSQSNEEDRLRFRCHTGHSFSSDGLLMSVSDYIEESFYKALRSVEEGMMLLNSLGDHFADKNEPGIAAMYFRKANEAESRSNLIRRATKSLETMNE